LHQFNQQSENANDYDMNKTQQIPAGKQPNQKNNAEPFVQFATNSYNIVCTYDYNFVVGKQSDELQGLK